MLAASLCLASPAGANDNHAALLIDANSGRVLYQSAADAPRHPASLAKLMTLYLVFERIEQGKLDYQSKLKISAFASAAAPSKLDLEPGEEIPVIDAIKALVTKSANDVAVALAEHLAGSEERFARLMTEKAHQIGMTATIFRNASGLPDEAQVTTARDMATLALRLMDEFPRHYRLFATHTFTYKGETYRNHNSLLFHYQGTDGLKTGYTRASGFNLVASVRRGRKHVLGVVFGGATAAARNTSMRALLNIGLSKGSPEVTRKPVVVARQPAAEGKLALLPPRPQPLSERREQALAPSPAALPAPAPQAATSSRIEMAQVRPVRIGHDPTPETGGAALGQPTTIEALIARTQSQAAPGEAADAEPPPAASQRPIVGDRPMLLAEPRLVRGTPPSTLDQQAATMAGGRSAATPLAPAAGVAIQIGAYSSADEAQRRLAWVRKRATAVIGTRTALTQPVTQGDKVFYRARFAGFDGAGATFACKELRALKVDCLVLKPEAGSSSP